MKIRRNEVVAAPPSSCFDLIVEGTSTSVAAFRVELADRIVSFARDELRRWTLLHGEPQRLVIHIGHDLAVSVVGKGLDALHEALDHDRLRSIRCSPKTGGTGPSIKSIELIERPEAKAKEHG